MTESKRNLAAEPVVAPALWLILVIVGLPQLSETVYTPALPDIARSLHVADSWVEYTLTIFLAGFAVGTLFWGNVSDRVGRKPCVLAGLFVYTLGCLGCYFSTSIEWLLFSRFVQAFGGSIGSVLGQAICRDVFHGPKLTHVYATIGAALALSPAIGPVVGGVIDQHFGWAAIFLALIACGIATFAAAWFTLPETHPHANAHRVSIWTLAKKLAQDKRVIGYGILVAASNGILFSYFAEGSFYLIDLLGLTPSVYGLSFLGIAAMSALGAVVSRSLNRSLGFMAVLGYGILLVVAATGFFTVMTLVFTWFGASQSAFTVLTLSSMMATMLGIGLILPNALSPALQEYRYAVGTASSLFGFFYYVLISLATLGMGALHNDTLIPMPVYFLALGLVMWFVFKRMRLISQTSSP